MKIAVTYENGQVFQHFGHTEQFKLYEVEDGRVCLLYTSAPAAGSPAYQRLEEVGRRLMEVIAHNKGGTNKDLGRFADQLRALIEKWDR